MPSLHRMVKNNSENIYKEIELTSQDRSLPVYAYEDLINPKFTPSYGPLFLDRDEIVIKDEKISILFTYPLSERVVLEFENKGGFTRLDLLRCILKGYEKIYENSDTEGGHELGDLFIDYVWYNSKTRMVELFVSS